MRLFSPSRERYVELEEAQSVLVPLRTTHMLLPEHFATPLAKLHFPTRLDFSHDRFKLRSLALLSLLRESALVEMVLAENELSSLDELNRFHALKILLAPRNTLESVEGVRLSLARLVRLDLNENQLREVPPLKGVPSLQVLSLSRNRIARGWPELVHCANLQGLDVSFNKLDWSPSSGEMSKAMAVLRGLRRLRVFQIQGNPVCEHNELRSWVLANAHRIELLDVKSARAIAEKAAAAAGSAAADGKEEGDGDADGDGEGRAPTPSRRLLGMPLHKVAGDEDLPELVQECARHVQERGAPTLQLLTAEGNASLVLQLRNGFERSTAEGIATLERLEDADHNDVRAACGLLRRFLLELPEPLIPVDMYLRSSRRRSGWEMSRASRAARRGSSSRPSSSPCPTRTHCSSSTSCASYSTCRASSCSRLPTARRSRGCGRRVCCGHLRASWASAEGGLSRPSHPGSYSSSKCAPMRAHIRRRRIKIHGSARQLPHPSSPPTCHTCHFPH